MKSFFDNIDLLQIICAYCQINDPNSTKQAEFDKLISYVKVKNCFFFTMLHYIIDSSNFKKGLNPEYSE